MSYPPKVKPIGTRDFHLPMLDRQLDEVAVSALGGFRG